MRLFYILKKLGNDNFFLFQAGLNFLIKAYFEKKIDNFLIFLTSNLYFFLNSY